MDDVRYNTVGVFGIATQRRTEIIGPAIHAQAVSDTPTSGLVLLEGTMKKCTRCGEIKSRTDFYKNSGHKDGLNSRCKSCSRAYDQEWRMKNPEKVRKNNRADIEKHREHYEMKWKRAREKNRIASNARGKFKWAIESGRIKRPKNCSKCGRTCKPVGHHENYLKPYDVRWLCKRCHTVRHDELKAALGKGE